MKRWIRSMAALLLLLWVLPMGAFAYEVPENLGEMSLESVMAAFMEDNGLNEENFSISYYNTVTGESYAFNDKAFMVAGSTYKLPLNMYYYEMERDGKIESDAYIAGAETTLDNAHYQSLVWSDNDISIGLLYNLGDFRTYKNCMRTYFTMPEEEIEYLYHVDNYYCVHMMMDALKYLYENSEDFEEMIGYMKQAQPDSYFRAGVTKYEVAHKYGLFEGALNDVGIIYTEEPFLLAVYTYGLSTNLLDDTAALLTAYNEAKTPAKSEGPEQQPEVPAEEVQTLPAEPVTTEPVEPEEAPMEKPPVEPTPAETAPAEPASPETEDRPVPWWAVAIGTGILLMVIGVLVIRSDPYHKEAHWERKHRERMDLYE